MAAFLGRKFPQLKLGLCEFVKESDKCASFSSVVSVCRDSTKRSGKICDIRDKVGREIETGPGLGSDRIGSNQGTTGGGAFMKLRGNVLPNGASEEEEKMSLVVA